MGYVGYHFFVDDLELPYAPSELNVNIDSNNKTVELINGNEINILKDPKLQEISFDVELPRVQYPFANELVDPKVYIDHFNKLLENKTAARLLITRPNPMTGRYSKPFYDTIYKKVSLEGYSWKEDAENAFDIKVSLKFKEYVDYKTVKKTVGKNKEQKISETPKTVKENESYITKKGDNLLKISRQFYGTGTKPETIYNANKKIIDKTARKYGKRDSNNGWWIYPGCKLNIPMHTKE